ncbi:hypothetical protein M2139_000268 [Enterococcus sp. PF1-24]|uniref:hypothetical protein n=1 Tax=unclassified Enterococcus TaxID=2608891 RepID=UPI0024750A8F|nr:MULTISPECIES: hypothetical protein [unclassified Enterococcus]MDH6363312.1 hypothetical protein [Enterococcus sp. PFB1-1]MDH6400387.1 hypothetical protein [Enterococcus sp. PF1-24]
MEKKQPNEYLQVSLILLMSVLFILFTQGIKLIKNPASTPITLQTFQGLAVLWSFSMIGIFVSKLVKRTGIKILADFPILGWVSLVSLFFCLISDFFVKAISGVDFLSITTPILAFAGISVANSLSDLRKTSWKIAIVAIFVFIGTYLGSSIIAQIGLWLSGK